MNTIPHPSKNKRATKKVAKKRAAVKKRRATPNNHSLREYLKASPSKKILMEKEQAMYDEVFLVEEERAQNLQKLYSIGERAINKAKIPERISDIKCVKTPFTCELFFYVDSGDNCISDCIDPIVDSAEYKKSVKKLSAEATKKLKAIKKEFTAILKEIGIGKNTDTYETLWEEAQFF